MSLLKNKAALFAAVSFVGSQLPALAHACPMCFNGNDNNQAAFLYGSLLLMFVPTTVIGGLVYWAWRRTCAQDAEQSTLERDPEPPPAAAAPPPHVTGAPALRAVARR